MRVSSCHALVPLLWCLCLGAWQSLAQEEGDLDVQAGCLVLDGKQMHEFGSELPFLFVSMAHCADQVGHMGRPVMLLTRLDGEDLQAYDFRPETLRVSLPLLPAGPHELAVSLRARGDGGSGTDEGVVIDEQFFLFFSSDFRPQLNWVFPPADYVFKRNSQRFLRFTVDDVGDPSRCQEGSTSCVGFEPLVYHAAYYVNGEKVGERMRSVYFLGLSFLPDGHHHAYVEISDKNHQPLGINHSVSFSIASEEEYLEDGAMAEKETPCPETTCPSDCGKMGRKSQGHCACAADWLGDRCEHHLLSQLSYLPDQDPHTASERCVKVINFLIAQVEVLREAQGKVWEEMAERLRVKLEELQHITDREQCRNSSRVSVVRIRGTNGHTGFASFVEQIAGALNGALRNGTMLYVRDFCDYLFHRACPRRSAEQEDLSCYFQPLFSGCGPDDVSLERSTEGQQVLEHIEDYKPPAEFEALGYFWWNSHLLNFIFAPNRKLAGLLRAVKSSLSFRNPIIGVHVRRGDSCKLKASPGYGMPLASCKHFRDFMPHVRNMSALYGVRTVFVTSDSPSVYSETAEFEAEGFSFVFSRADREFLSHDWLLEMRLRMALVDRKQVAEATLTDILLLADCDYLILGLQSGYSRLALSLAAARKGFVPPYVSMDYPWMPRFGMSGPRPPWREWWR